MTALVEGIMVAGSLPEAARLVADFAAEVFGASRAVVRDGEEQLAVVGEPLPAAETDRRKAQTLSAGQPGAITLEIGRDGDSPFADEVSDGIGALARILELRHHFEVEQRSRLYTEALHRSLIERIPAIIYTAEIGEKGRWRYVSPQIEEMLGFKVEEWLEDPGLWARQLHPDDRERALANERLVANGEHVPVVDYRLFTRSGEVVWVLDDASVETDAEGLKVWNGVLFDITDRKQAERALERLAAQQASLAELGQRAIEGQDLSLLMSSAVKLVMSEGVTHSCVWERVQRGGGLRLRVGLERSGAPIEGRASAATDTHVGMVARTGKLAIVEDWEREERFQMPPALAKLGIRSSLAVVIDDDEEPFGVLDVHSDRPGHFGESETHLIRAAANVLASAIQRRGADEEMRHRVLHDALTGLPNRQLFTEMLDQALLRAQQTDMPIAVLFLDLDHFKLINDSLGHHVGDELLRIVAPRLAGRLRPADIVARFGGDEFGMLIEHLTDEAEAVAIADRIGRALSRPISIDGTDHFVTASIGIAVADPRSDKNVDAESLIRDADAAMYRAKERGRARHQLFGEEMRAFAIRRLETQRKLRDAVERDELEVRYQPVVSLASGAIVGTEALVRWRHPQRGLLSPNSFIPVAEESGLIAGIGRWVIEHAVEQTQGWQQSRPDERPITIAVNISPRQVTQQGLVDTVAEVLGRTGFDPGCLLLEITESVLVEESLAVSDALDALHRLGVRLVLDDFGTGYSSLGYLKRFPLSALKIDRSFIEKLGRDGEGTAIVEAILAMAKALSLEVIAEGVAAPEQAEILRRMGCGFGQGYLFARPLRARDVPGLLENPDRILAALGDLS